MSSNETPTLDLLYEHSLLNRYLMNYDKCADLLDTNNININKEMVVKIVYSIALFIRKFIEDYHEKNEEKYIFPLVDKYGSSYHKKIVKILINEHHKGRKITTKILNLSSKFDLTNISTISSLIRIFSNMYRLHENNEDLIIYRFISLKIPNDIKYKITEYQESSESKIFGNNAFNKFITTAIELEKFLNILTEQQFLKKKKI